MLDRGQFFIPVGFNLTKAIYESPFYWMIQDKAYRDRASEHRGEATEAIAEKLLIQVFGEGRVYRNIAVLRGKDRITDIDVLAIAGDRAIIVQAKSKRLTELSKMGNNNQLRIDFTEAIQKAYDQGLACRKALLTKENRLVDSNGNTIVLPESIKDAHIICLTLDSRRGSARRV